MNSRAPAQIVSRAMGTPRVVVAGSVPAGGRRPAQRALRGRGRRPAAARGPARAAAGRRGDRHPDRSPRRRGAARQRRRLAEGRGELRRRLRQHRSGGGPRRGAAGHQHARVLNGATAELAVTLDARRRPPGRRGRRDRPQRAVARAPAATVPRARPVGATVGIVGFGRIGQRVARLLRGFDVRIALHRRSRSGLGRPGRAPSS